jgi:hypothetical protein
LQREKVPGDGYLSLEEFKKLSQLREEFQKKKKKDE